ncbi:hypothetical protein M406DRAFT_68129 [Cryphonectria parasitica EP155]|uniref:Uncharacterized protein n=1 Tax=Cryphonectria parasitica (strain ATCC 38755 / EP155) TaxID=660469 RepID=A0A9P5CNQ5_CRYP1|nr:uncharacterized protein M406DRAFT_68129 [Cryphonectria parasitica EP155]KAF3765709.1 hypothetical protein M406DRAFT_68129 [Cryphonectria parasitica EP155]
MTISTEIGYIMAAMEDAGCDSKKLFSPSAASSSNSTSKPPAKPCPKPTSQKAKAIEEKEEELRYSTDSESILKGMWILYLTFCSCVHIPHRSRKNINDQVFDPAF